MKCTWHGVTAMWETNDKCDGHCQTFTGGACVGLQVFGSVDAIYECEKHQTVTVARLFVQ